jgi:hypothetical protein
LGAPVGMANRSFANRKSIRLRKASGGQSSTFTFEPSPVITRCSKNVPIKRMKQPYFYHGTQNYCVHSIMAQGFRLEYEMWGRGLGHGVYLSGTEEFASLWGDVIVRCELKAGCNILWHDDYDRKIVAYLKREFGAGILKPDFWKVLPKNKQLTKPEIIAVWNYLMANHYLGRRVFEKGLLRELQQQYSRVYEQLKRQKFDGVGYREDDWPEMLIFNPSSVRPVSVHRWSREKKRLSDALDDAEIVKIQEEAENERRMEMADDELPMLTAEEHALEWEKANI